MLDYIVESLSNMACSGQESSFHEYAMEWITSIDRGIWN